MMKLSAVAQVLGGEVRNGDAVFERVSIDSRAIAAGDLFVALRGERFDAHAFVAQAQATGAVAALVSEWVPADLPQVRVHDTLDGLQRLAQTWRNGFTVPVVAVTGSNGKTTTKQLLAAVFAARGPVLATRGNLNNHIGVPLTLLGLREEHRTAVIEMGANHLHEIALLTRLARPNVGVVTQAGSAHLEGFGSHENIARGKGELFAGLEAGVAVINADDAYAPLWRGLATRAAHLHFGFSEHADVRAQNCEPLADGSGSRFVLRTPGGSADVQLPLPGRHNVMNALAAAGCAVALGMDAELIARGLGGVEAPRGRLSWLRTPQGTRVLDDSYNANPDSLRAGLELLAAQPGRRTLVLGDMAELGPEAADLHREAGRLARRLGVERLHALGPLAAHAASAFGPGAAAHASLDTLLQALREQVDSDSVVLVKGSRSARMERVVDALVDRDAGGAH